MTDEPAEPTSSPEDEGHQPDGLDLAKTVARRVTGGARSAATGSTGSYSASRRKKRIRPTQPDASGSRRNRPPGSGAYPDERDPQMLSGVVGRLVSEHGWEIDLKVHAVFGRWSQIVGEQVAQHCAPTSYADGQLVVRADSTAWATQIRLLAPNLVRRLNTELGHGTVLRIVVEGPTAPSWTRGRFSTRDGRGPRDTYG